MWCGDKCPIRENPENPGITYNHRAHFGGAYRANAFWRKVVLNIFLLLKSTKSSGLYIVIKITDGGRWITSSFQILVHFLQSPLVSLFQELGVSATCKIVEKRWRFIDSIHSANKEIPIPCFGIGQVRGCILIFIDFKRNASSLNPSPTHNAGEGSALRYRGLTGKALRKIFLNSQELPQKHGH